MFEDTATSLLFPSFERSHLMRARSAGISLRHRRPVVGGLNFYAYIVDKLRLMI